MLLTDPFREIDRWTEQLLGTAARPALMAMDAWREGTQIVVEFDLPGVRLESLDVDVERNMLTVRGERPAPGADHEMVSAERPHGVFSRQILLGENLDTDKIEANYQAGVLRLTIPVAESARPRRVEIASPGEKTSVSA